MKRIEYRGVVDKSVWPRGAWDNEPDKVQWPDEVTGMPCLAVRGPGGHWCGYVGVAEGHPLHGVDYSTCPGQCSDSWCNHTPESILKVHGGITFADACQASAKEDHGICHLPALGEPDHVWWFGFDCAHAGDLAPKFDSLTGRHDRHDVYRDLSYVQEQCADLAKQLHAMQSTKNQ